MLPTRGFAISAQREGSKFGIRLISRSSRRVSTDPISAKLGKHPESPGRAKMPKNTYGTGSSLRSCKGDDTTAKILFLIAYSPLIVSAAWE